ncbi:uncharacterized protein LOC106140797 [Amyelois transitella]|uniref:uncharacterized protein LOC106140797 n=1 Tax=Amyelois transitella TaxID=680683 RepID=UPI00067CDD4A|nr:uncharacterized protein LOC106140797 [Amyelois transitella]
MKMSGFKNLRDICNDFEADLRQVSNELYSAKLGETFEDGITKKLQDLSLFTSKLRLLRAKPIAASPQIAEQEKTNDTTIASYEETAVSQVLECQVVKFLAQTHAVRSLITTQDRILDPELVDRKERIIEAMDNYKTQECRLRQLSSLLRERQDRLAVVQKQWESELGDMRQRRGAAKGDGEAASPVDRKLSTIVERLEIMCWLLGRLVTARAGGYDWLADPHGRLAALKLARQVNTVANFIE